MKTAGPHLLILVAFFLACALGSGCNSSGSTTSGGSGSSSGGSGSSGSGGQSSSSCTPSFPLAQGWLGADGDTSLSIGSGKSVWFFDDSFISPTSETSTRLGSAFIHDSIGVSTCSSGSLSMQYSWGTGTSQTDPSAFFPVSSFWYWPSDAVLSGSDAYVALMNVDSSGTVDGVTLATISNITASPSSWEIQYNSLTSNDVGGIQPGSAMTLDSTGDYLLLYTLSSGTDGAPVYLARIPLSGMSDPLANIQYYSTSGTWENGLPSSSNGAAEVMSEGDTEFTVRYHSSLGEWVAILTTPPSGGFYSQTIWAMTAQNPQGPWSSPVAVYTFPEMADTNPETESVSANNPWNSNWCYAAKEHTEFAPSNSELSVTYDCNNSYSSSSTDDEPVVWSDMSIYVPKAITIETSALPAAP